MDGQRVRIMRISNEILLALLHLPEGTEIVDVNTTRMFEFGELELKVSHPDFPPVKRCHQIPLVSPQYSRRTETMTKDTVVFEGWDGNTVATTYRGCGLVE